jgi:hypothetical protein
MNTPKKLIRCADCGYVAEEFFGWSFVGRCNVPGAISLQHNWKAISVISEFDKKNVQRIMDGMGNWFTAKLLRLLAESDYSNREKFRLGFPEHVELFEKWERGELENGD